MPHSLPIIGTDPLVNDEKRPKIGSCHLYLVLRRDFKKLVGRYYVVVRTLLRPAKKGLR